MTEMAQHNGFHPMGDATTPGPLPLGPPTPPRFPVSAPLPIPLRTPMPAPMPEPEPPRRTGGRARVVLAVVAALLLAAGIVFGVLYVSARGDHDAAVARLTEREGTLAEANLRVSSTDSARQAADRRNSALETENAQLTTCVEAVRHYLWDGLVGAEREAAVEQLFTACG